MPQWVSWDLNGSNQVITGSNMGQMWVTFVAWVMFVGPWVMWVLRAMWVTGQVDLCKMAIGATGFNQVSIFWATGLYKGSLGV